MAGEIKAPLKSVHFGKQLTCKSQFEAKKIIEKSPKHVEIDPEFSPFNH